MLLDFVIVSDFNYKIYQHKFFKSYIFAKINAAQFGKSLLGIIFLFKKFPATATLIQITFLYACFPQNLLLQSFDVGLLRTLDRAFYFKLPITIKSGNTRKPRSIFNPYYPRHKPSSF